MLRPLLVATALFAGVPSAAETPSSAHAAVTASTDAPAANAPTRVELDQQAPGFTLTDLDGAQVSLSDFAGKTVVLEWFNPGCPFVVHAHAEGPLGDMASRWAEQGVVWLAVNSGAPGKQGHGAQANRDAAAEWGMSHPVLIDESGDVGRRYGATNTPQLYVIDPSGVLRYQGALDNAPLGKVKGGARADYVNDALTALAAGEPVKPPETKAYGCGVKY